MAQERANGLNDGDRFDILCQLVYRLLYIGRCIFFVTNYLLKSISFEYYLMH